MRRAILVSATVLAICIAGAEPASAQLIPADVQAADVTQARWQATLAKFGTLEAALADLARNKAFSERMLVEIARRLKLRSPKLTPAQILERLDRQIDELVTLRQRLGQKAGEDTPEIAALRARALKAYDALRFDEVEQLITRVVALRRIANRERQAEQEAANDQAQAWLVRDMVLQASVAGARADYDRQIAILLDALKEVPARRPVVAAYVKGMLNQVYHTKAATQRDAGAARLALEGVRAIAKEVGGPFHYPFAAAEARDLMLIAEIEPSRDHWLEAAAATRTLIANCKAAAASPETPPPNLQKLQFGECHASTGAPGIALGRSALIQALLELKLTWDDGGALIEVEPLLEAALADPQVQADEVEVAFATMRLGVVYALRASELAEAGYYDRAITMLQRALSLPVTSRTPTLAATVRVNLASALAGRGRAGEALPIIERALQDVDAIKQRDTWIALHVSKATAGVSLVDHEPGIAPVEEVLKTYRALLQLTPPVAPPIRLARIRIDYADMLMTRFARAGDPADLIEAQSALRAAGEVVGCQSSPADLARFEIAQGDLAYQFATRSAKWVDLLASANFYRLAIASAERSANAALLAKAQHMYAQTLGFASFAEKQGGFTMAGNAIWAFDAAIAGYEQQGRLDLAIDAALTEVRVFSTIAASFSNRAQRRALLDSAAFAAARAKALGEKVESPATIVEATNHLQTIATSIADAKLGKVKPAKLIARPPEMTNPCVA